MPHNPNCCGSHCDGRPAIRILPYPNGILFCCRSCYEHEIAWRRERNRRLAPECQYPIPAWTDLEPHDANPSLIGTQPEPPE